MLRDDIKIRGNFQSLQFVKVELFTPSPLYRYEFPLISRLAGNPKIEF